jgi:hypothetical protein
MRPVGLAVAKAGRESGGVFFVLGYEEGRALLADGRRRKVAAPKKKNPRHIELLPPEEFGRAAAGLGEDVTDRQIIRALAAHKSRPQCLREGTEVWQKTI